MLSDALKADAPRCADYADALADFLDALKLDRVNTVGNSFGGLVGQCFAMHYPTRLITLAIADGVGGNRTSEADKASFMAMSEARIASGGYGFGAGADALVGPHTSPEFLPARACSQWSSRDESPRLYASKRIQNYRGVQSG